MPTISKSPFQFIENRVTKLRINNSLINLSTKGLSRSIRKLDYNVNEITEDADLWLGSLSLDLEIAFSVKTDIKFSAEIEVEGAFKGAKNQLTRDQFEKSLEINGSATLLSITRGILISVSSLCGFDGQVRIPLVNMVAFYHQKHKDDDKSNSLPDETESKQ